MHFWIDKRSQCSYAGRHRVPTSLSSGRSRGRVCVGTGTGRKGMAAPVHRFAAVDCPPRRPHRTRHQPGPASAGAGAAGAGGTTRRAAEAAALYVQIPPSPASPPQPTIASLAAARSVTPDTLLRTAALGLHNPPMMAPHLKFGIFVSFALASMFLVGAKYCFDRQLVPEERSGGGAGVVCGVVACMCGVGCVYSMCRAPPAALHAPDRVSSTAQRILQPPSSPPREPPAPAGRETEQAPPPYHIAVLLPPRADSPPPPAYHALS